jgi:hypothetical protein
MNPKEKQKFSSEILVSHSGDHKDHIPLECDALYSVGTNIFKEPVATIFRVEY